MSVSPQRCHRLALHLFAAPFLVLIAIAAPVLGQSCGSPGSGSCLVANGSTACISQSCCNTVCAADSFCCNNTWDTTCVGEAYDLCSVSIDSVSPDTGEEAGGTMITIVGELLSGPSTSTDVTVGGNPCTNLIVTDDNQVACETPAGSGSADVVVVNNEPDLVQDSDTLPAGFTYLLDLLFEDRFEPAPP